MHPYPQRCASPARDAASPARDELTSRGRYDASPNFGICDGTE